ncbi:MAG TPA: hypothetical protein EYQ54_06895 [Myxococcales bacterium]|nr:hypothetical protein [Myxococcales bacterium]
MWNVIECAGHPRDLGLQQGLAQRSAIRRHAEQLGLSTRRNRWPSLAGFTSGGVRGSGSAREMIRHFTHLSERADGLARGAGLPVDSILRLQAVEGPNKEGTLGLCSMGLGDEPGASLTRTLSASPWLVRRSRPEVGFASLEVTEAWSVSALAGINEAGLAVCFVPARTETSPPVHDPIPSGPGSASANFLVQECLQRFEELEAGVDWCLNRPAAGAGTILLADAGGHRGAVHFAPGACEAERAGGEPLLAGGSDSAREKVRAWALSESGVHDEPLGRVMGGQADSSVVRLVCAQRQLELRQGEGQGPMLSLRVE